MVSDPLEDLIGKAHALYEETSIFELLDTYRDTAILILSVYDGLPDMEKIERYFAILDEVRACEDPPDHVGKKRGQDFHLRTIIGYLG